MPPILRKKAAVRTTLSQNAGATAPAVEQASEQPDDLDLLVRPVEGWQTYDATRNQPKAARQP